MDKPLIVKLFVGSLIALVGAGVLFLVAGGLAIWQDSFVMNGPDVVGIKSGPFGWTMIGLAGIAVLVMVCAAIAQFVAWVGAVLNTAQLDDKAWFLVLLLTGLFSLGFVAMIAYVIAGPDGTRPAPAVVTGPGAQAPAPPVPAHHS
ncbi:hypothetical protein JOE57_000052 [Microlunatus panaciterrae]|uniref:Uncharacterized protein n=1 Tax=Microlunatus panaciterrae TaxID=400768 RepID=A0ABS2RG20_9ACTN|nr:hypothetical protein [Microlunatus panaciterrae]MBM7797131.1 hypothetical protein [Microlunatus panaciterrae]